MLFTININLLITLTDKKLMASNLNLEQELNATAQFIMDQSSHPSQLSLSIDKIGIGTNAPTNKLHIAGSAPADANDAQFKISNTEGKFVLVGRAADYAFVQSHNREPLALNPLGNNVGIGTNTPTNRLHIAGGSPADANDAQLKISNTKGNFVLVGRASDYAFVQSHNREPLVLNPLGNNVGIGTTTPKERLDVNGNIRTTGDVQLSGADCAEDFDVENLQVLEPGMVMVIGEENKLLQCTDAYDKKVAGVLSGAGDYKPGIILDRQQSLERRMPLALSGKVFCKVDAQYSSICVGDLLTTSPTPGYAMKAVEPGKAFGAVIGKALRAFGEGQGMIPILIALQ